MSSNVASNIEDIILWLQNNKKIYKKKCYKRALIGIFTSYLLLLITSFYIENTLMIESTIGSLKVFKVRCIVFLSIIYSLFLRLLKTGLATFIYKVIHTDLCCYLSHPRAKHTMINVLYYDDLYIHKWWSNICIV